MHINAKITFRLLVFLFFIGIISCIIFIINKSNKEVLKVKHPDIVGNMSPSMRNYFLDLLYSKGHQDFIGNFKNACDKVDSLNEDERFIFYLNAFLLCNLDAGNWLIFCSKIQEDNNFFWKKLTLFSKTSDFEELTKSQKEKIKEYIDMYNDDNNYFNVN
ncbi:MAG: hypothetical protein A2020_11080 [Lentisphaerae bacterium GWF2_45_14]|nr:MAG: hypothetical protein A2020_11080 [Lentisphaerae bacterium GWF2_45_14]